MPLLPFGRRRAGGLRKLLFCESAPIAHRTQLVVQLLQNLQDTGAEFESTRRECAAGLVRGPSAAIPPTESHC